MEKKRNEFETEENLPVQTISRGKTAYRRRELSCFEFDWVDWGRNE